jgi:CRISPR-associated protein Cas2
VYVLVTYDVDARRTEHFRKTLSRYLFHEQNSVFAGYMTASQLKMLRRDLTRIAEKGDRLFEVVAENRYNVSVSLLRKSENGILEIQEHGRHHMHTDII